MSEPIVYRARGARFFIVVFGVFTVGAIVGVRDILATDSLSDASVLQMAFLAAFVVALVWGWVLQLWLVSLSVELWPGTGRLRFRSVFRATETQLREVESVRPWLFFGGPVVVRFDGGFAVLSPVYGGEGRSGLVSRIRAANPDVRVENV